MEQLTNCKSVLHSCPLLLPSEATNRIAWRLMLVCMHVCEYCYRNAIVTANFLKASIARTCTDSRQPRLGGLHVQQHSSSGSEQEERNRTSAGGSLTVGKLHESDDHCSQSLELAEQSTEYNATHFL